MRLVHRPDRDRLSFSIEIPADWVVVGDTRTGELRALRGGRLVHQDERTTVEGGVADFLLRPFDIPGGGLAEYPGAEMARHVPLWSARLPWVEHFGL
jgi:hypothetical protein